MPFSESNSNVLSAISIENVSFAYRAIPVLEQVNISVAQGESVSIVGPNGGGKTTLVKLILGLLQPEEGSVRVFGRAPVEARLEMGYMPQHAEHDLQFPVTVMDVVLMGRLGQPGLNGFFGRHGSKGRAAVVEALDRVAMADFRRRPFAALSGGQRQRVLIARALVSRPKLLLLDEPTANVDVAGGSRLLEILHQLQSEMTIVMVSHDLAFVADLVRKVICVNRTVQVHPTSRLTGDVIHNLYEHDIRMVQHDQHLSD